MRWRFRRVRTVERTCLDCGETWTVTSKLAKARPPGPSRRGFSAGTARYAGNSAQGMSRASIDQQMAEAHRRDAQADRELEALRQAQTCPKCGSDHYAGRT
jgi:hypothetical protein